ncbi:tetratricopeptide repeat protein [Kribbella solani]|uniref:Tetratricopeptide (TPR) repeat protein n=1 Tax=Kribbella solani TaxID=236067 RepID=A0A841DKI8_9ACTN|nr:tetratricopeptide repeat protein [Kribbella solani]MBB5977296.1 tetratricopeptide (TPR) repeat protein [Kribbella solani]
MAADGNSSQPGRAFDASEPVLNAIRPPAAARIWTVSAPVGNFVNRTELVAAVTALATTPRSRPPVLAIHGVPGSGKTSVLRRLADAVEEYFDHAIELDLEQIPGGAMADVLGSALSDLGVDLAAVPPDLRSRRSRFLAVTDRRRVLVLVDGATDAAQISQLTPNSSAAMVIAAGNIRLDDLALDGATVRRLGGLDAEHGLELMSTILGADRLAGQNDAVDRLVTLCSGSPLGLKIAARQLQLEPELSVEHLVADLESRVHDAEPTPARAGIRHSLTAIFDSFEDVMRKDVAMTYRALGTVPADRWPKETITALLAETTVDVGAALSELVRLDLLQLTDGGYRMLSLVRSHAERAGWSTDTGLRDAGRARMIRSWRSLAVAADHAVQRDRFRVTPTDLEAGSPAFADAQDAMRWFETWHDALLEVIVGAAAQGLDTEAWQIFEACWPFHTSHNLYHEWIKAGTVAVESAERSADRRAEARMRCYRARAWMEQGDLGQAEADIQAATELSNIVDDRALRASVLDFEGQLRARYGDAASALAAFDESLRLNEELGDRRGIALQSQFRGRCLNQLGRYDEALAALNRAEQLITGLGDHRAESRILHSKARVFRALRRSDDAVEALNDALRRVAPLGQTTLVVAPLELLRQLAQEAGDAVAETSYLTKLQSIFAATDDPRGTAVGQRLTELGHLGGT